MKLLAIALIAILRACGISGQSQSCHLTEEQFYEVVAAAGYNPPPKDVYSECIATQCTKYSCEELAMMLAQFMHESGGFSFKEEWKCSHEANRCEGDYVDDVGHKDKKYYGRGFVQLTWGANYKKAGEALGVDLLEHPELVAETDMACKTSLWYWDTYVHPFVGDARNFGVTTEHINGPIECRSETERAKNRFKIYEKVAAVMGIKNLASEHGCYV